jgi:hypothetical protein
MDIPTLLPAAKLPTAVAKVPQQKSLPPAHLFCKT